MKKFKKLLSVFLAVAVICGLMMTVASAAVPYANYSASDRGTNTSINETQHKITCDLCGRVDTGAHDFEFSAEGDSTSQECKKTCKICPYEKCLGTYSITPDFEVPFDQTRGKTLTVTAPAGAQLTNIRWYVDGATDPAPNINGMTFTLYLMRPF